MNEKELYEKIQETASDAAVEMSMEELDAVSGGVIIHDYEKTGCSATVEFGSNCYSTDGGCTVANISYENPPGMPCPACRKKGLHYNRQEGAIYIYHCKYCGYEVEGTKKLVWSGA